jgi:DNA-binding CsgD family transcriptional regulator
MELVVSGKRNWEIAVQLGISPRAVEMFKARMLWKMGANSAADPALMAGPPQ